MDPRESHLEFLHHMTLAWVALYNDHDARALEEGEWSECFPLRAPVDTSFRDDFDRRNRSLVPAYPGHVAVYMTREEYNAISEYQHRYESLALLMEGDYLGVEEDFEVDVWVDHLRDFAQTTLVPIPVFVIDVDTLQRACDACVEDGSVFGTFPILSADLSASFSHALVA